MKKILLSIAISFSTLISFAQNNINGYEYWFDNDFAYKTTIPVAPTQQLVVNQLVSTSGLTSGIHTFNFRSFDNNGVYSSVASSFFYKTSAISNNPNPTVVAYEYWLDNDFANAVTVSTPAQQQVNVNELISMSAIPSGIQTFNVRFKDNLNVWSSVASSFFYKSAQQTVVQNQVVGYRYWFDNDFASAVYMLLTANVEVNVMDNLDMTQIPKGMHQVHFQFKDTLQQWSVVVADSVEKISFPIANFTYSSTQNCDSTTITFANNSIDGDTHLWDFGDGTTDTTANPTHSYYTAGSYLVSLTVTDTLTLADSTYQTTLFVTGNTAHSFAVTTCDSYTSPSGNFTFTTSGTYYDTIPNQWGCDSLLTIMATINQATTSSDIITACDSYTWIDGNTYTGNNNTATHILTNTAGCDSIVTLNLTINTVNTDVAQNSTILTANATGATYQWLDCNNGNSIISGETSQSFTATQNGSYAVKVTQNDCTDTSACYAVTTVGILENTFSNDIIVYPNPTDGIVKIDLGETLTEFMVSIMDVNGKLVRQSIYKNTKMFELNLNVQPGIYLLTINSGNNKATIRLIKN